MAFMCIVYRKMMLGFSAVIAIIVISSAYVLFELDTISNSAQHILTSNVQIQERAKKLQNIIQDENGYIKKYLISKDEIYFSLFIETSKQIDLNLKLLLDKQSSNKEQSLILNMINAHNVLVERMKNKNFNFSMDHNQINQEKMRILLNSLDILIIKNQSFIGEEISRLKSVTARSFQIALILIAGTLLVAITAALIITQTITSPIKNLIKGTEQIAKGKFETIHVSANDEIALLADAINDMSSKINDINKLRTQTMQQISHELKTPLQAMQSAHDVLKASKAVRDDKLNMLKVIKTGIGKVTNFSQQYLDLAKIESGVMQYDLELIDLIKIVKPVFEEAKLVADSKNINIKLAAAVPNVMVDIKKVSMIISNLISNAIKYTPDNGMISVSIRPCDIGVQIEVQDSGIGIHQNEISNIFTRFYQASNIKKITCSGSGVGLAIVKAYTQGHGGKVLVKSSLDQGSSFKVEFPTIENKPLQAQKKSVLS